MFFPKFPLKHGMESHNHSICQNDTIFYGRDNVPCSHSEVKHGLFMVKILE